MHLCIEDSVTCCRVCVRDALNGMGECMIVNVNTFHYSLSVIHYMQGRQYTEQAVAYSAL